MTAFTPGRVLLAAAAWLPSCAGNDVREADADLALKDPMPWAIRVDVRTCPCPSEQDGHCEGNEVDTWGTEEEWSEDLVSVLRDPFHVSEVIFHGDAGPDAPEADVKLEVTVSPLETRQPTVEASAATLEVLAWVTIPLLPIWIRDVQKDPGIQLDIKAYFEDTGEVLLEERRPPLSSLATSLTERVPFFSWTTLGALVLPPFVYEGEDRTEHMEASIGGRVRRLAAAEVAGFLARLEDKKPLLREIEVHRQDAESTLSFLVEPEVIRLRRWRNGKPWGKEETLALGRGRAEKREYELPPDTRFVRIEAVSTDLEGRVRSYTKVISMPRKEILPP